MQLFHDIRIGKMFVIVFKQEKPDFTFNCTGRNFDGFIFITDGDGTFTDASGEYPLKRGSVMLLEENSKYIFKGGKKGISYITTGFSLHPSGGFTSLGLPTFIDTEKHPYILKQAEKMLDMWENRSPFFIMESRHLSERILLDLINICQSAGIGFEFGGRLSPALTFINQNYDKSISNEQLAELCDLSTTHFRRLFKEQFGTSPMQYRESLRLHWAIKLLESQMFTISEVADKLGYSDIYHFSKVIKRSTGNPPSFYKK